MDERKEREPLLSTANVKLLKNPLVHDNPITVQVLGICSALAITVKLEPSVVMALSVVAVLAFSNVIMSLIRNITPPRIRIIVMLTIIATMVILVDQVLKAFLYDVSKQLSVFVGLIITNCIIMGRLEAFAQANKPWPSFLDGVGNAIGYGWILIVVGFLRELLGSGTIWGYDVTHTSYWDLEKAGYVNNGLMILPPAALIIVGVIIWVQRYRHRDLIEEY
ncbi:MAG: NADH:ubiquinone reductase (Na(+)-transporting) subunit D [Bacteroidales bacterium]|nr:NADH:ubiquinone reductase (Na(+)-transporting) subunit D [Bacteroidales bacterium]